MCLCLFVCLLAIKKFSSATAASSLLILPPCPCFIWDKTMCLCFWFTIFFYPVRMRKNDTKTHTHTSLSRCIWHNVFCTCLLICLNVGFVNFFIYLCQHNMRIFPFLCSPHLGWPNMVITSTICCFDREKHKKWWVGENGSEKYLEEYFSCGKTKRSFWDLYEWCK